jgi:hypothetical protein
MRGKIILLLSCVAWGTAAAPAKPAPKWRWSLTSELHADTYNGTKPANPQIDNSTDSYCDTAMSEALLDRLLRHGLDEECKFDPLSYAGGKISYGFRCEKKSTRMVMIATGAGTYDERSLRVDIKAHATRGDNEMYGSGTLIGVRNERCG